MKNFDAKLESFIAGVNDIRAKHYAKHFPNIECKIITARKGKRYVKLIDGSRVFCFVDMTNGDVLKAATWSAPAKGARGNIFDENNGLARITAYGTEYNG